MNMNPRRAASIGAKVGAGVGVFCAYVGLFAVPEAREQYVRTFISINSAVVVAAAGGAAAGYSWAQVIRGRDYLLRQVDRFSSRIFESEPRMTSAYERLLMSYSR